MTNRLNFGVNYPQNVRTAAILDVYYNALQVTYIHRPASHATYRRRLGNVDENKQLNVVGLVEVCVLLIVFS